MRSSLIIQKLLYSKRLIIVFLTAFFLFVFLLFPSQTNAFVQLTGGDGYVPIVYQDRLFNIFHHQHISGDALNPEFDINCVERSTGSICANYPRFFSSTNGSSGSLGLGTPGTADIDTSYYPQAIIEGSRMFYAAQRASDNGVGCFDLATGTNCGYTQLGTLAWSGSINTPSMADGVERIGNKVYSIGSDLQMYCLDITTPASPVACTSQPYAINTGITAQMPTYNGTGWGTLRQIVGTRMYISVNYNNQTPAANARITCFDSLTTTRCAGWSSLEVTGTSTSPARGLFEFPDTSGVTTAICAGLLITNGTQCWDTTTLLSTSSPPNLLTGVTNPNVNTWMWDDLRVSNRTYFAISAGGSGNFGITVCYDFTTQAKCTGFGSSGVKTWNGADGGLSINSGDTRDYGYSISSDGLCMYGLGDAGVLWSFDSQSGSAPGDLACNVGGITTTNTTTGGSSSSVCNTISDSVVVPIIIDSKRIDADSIFISWGPYSGINTFNVAYGLENGKWIYNTNITGFSITINDLPPNQPIWVHIAARNDCRIDDYGDPKLVGGPRLPKAGFAPTAQIYQSAW